MERRGKSSPEAMVTWTRCKPYPMQHRVSSRLRLGRPDRPLGDYWVARDLTDPGALRRRSAKIDGRRTSFEGNRTRLIGEASNKQKTYPPAAVLATGGNVLCDPTQGCDHSRNILNNQNMLATEAAKQSRPWIPPPYLRPFCEPTLC